MSVDELIESAKNALARMPDTSTTTSVVVDSNGDTYVGYGAFRGHYNGSICGEISAILTAINAVAPESLNPEMVASLKMKEGKVQLINTCGRCLQYFKDTFPGLKIVSSLGGKYEAVSIDDLLPHGYDELRSIV